jgi:hypothetical protein
MKVLNTQFYDYLRSDICAHADIAMLNYSDSLLLSAKMSSAGISISPHTVARFYGFLPHRRLYPATLRSFCNYLGFNDFQEYVAFKQKNHERSLITDRQLFTNSTFSEFSFQLAFELIDELSIQNHLEALNPDHEQIEQLAHLTGFLVRKSKQQERILKLLIEQQNGRTLFYERFVDEDDVEGYYSEALKKHYLKAVRTENNKLFYYSYLISNAIYKSKPIASEWIIEFERIWLTVDLQVLHFHEISRLLEVRVLLLEKNFHSTPLNKLIDHIQEILENMTPQAQAWVLARFLRAIAYIKEQEIVFSSNELSLLLERINTKVSIQSIGELIIQFFYHLTNKGTNSYNLTPPLQIDSRFTDNEFSTRICTEVATRYLYAKNHEQHLLFDQLNAYCRNSGNNWIMNLLHSVR